MKTPCRSLSTDAGYADFRSPESFGSQLTTRPAALERAAMQRLAMVLIVVLVPACVPAASADGIFGLFGKKTRTNPADHVPELIATLKADQDDRKRAHAASALGTIDANAHPEIVPALADALVS